MNNFEHYFKRLPTGLTHVDVYWVLRLFRVNDPCIQHAIKKLLVPGKRGVKSEHKDVEEAIASLQRFLQMEKEDVF
ncbi:hypothetical protein [Pseudomonas phage PPAT]|nr:hypothetical protein [Pseudomonas phage PPAT]